jgi:peptidoglycan/xylan/chitin deacetylase (PgdA/CDA1 family)
MDDKHAWVGTVARRLGGACLVRHLIPRNHIRIVMTHHVFDEDLEQFDHIVRFLGAELQFLDPSQFFRHYDEPSPEPIVARSLLWTFDDGLLSAYTAAQQVLNPMGVKAIFFIPTAIIDLRTHEQMREFAHTRILFGTRAVSALRREEYITMSAEHLQELHQQGHTILPHTHSHVHASDIATPQDVVLELIRPRCILEDLLQSPADAVAIPVGTPGTVSTYSYRQIASVYSACFTGLGGPNTANTDPRFLRRDSIHPWYSAEHARNIVDGIFDPYFSLRMKALHRRAGGRFLPARREARADGKPVPPRVARDAKGRFFARVADAFERAGIDYVFLHGYGARRGIDSDLDVAVARDSLNRTDALIRSGAFGRVVQCLHHGVPWCRYYVVEVEEPGRRHRQIDVVCDPWGIGPDGPAVPVALSSALRSAGMRIPKPAAEALYLAVKRARKRMHGFRDQAELRRVFRRDPEGAAGLLERHFGAAGAGLARALDQGEPDVMEELEALRKRVVRQRRSPAALARRLVLAPIRIVRRLLRPTGLAVCVVGPDAECKSLAAGLERETEGVFRRVTLLRPSPRLRPSPATPGAVGSLAWFAFLWLDTLARWPGVALGRARASLVIVERGSPAIAVNPRRYGIALPLRVIRIVGRALPQPDLTVCVDGSTSAETTLELALAAIGDRLAARQRHVRPRSDKCDGPPDGIRTLDALGSTDAGRFPLPPRHERRRTALMTDTKREEAGANG